MTLDLTSGMDASSDHFLAERPTDPQFRESASMWISDDEGTIGIPRAGIEAVAGSWELRGLQVNVAFPDGRAVVVREAGAGSNPLDDEGVCRRFQAGGLEFRCDEPFKQSTMTYEGTAVDTTAQALSEANLADGPRVDLEVHVEVTMAAPPWVPGTLVAEAAEAFNEGFAGLYISPRYEQLCTTRGSVRVGKEEWSFTGTGLRIHRQGVRDTEGFWGHCWPSALFPSGRGFGVLAFPDRPNDPTFNEGYVFTGDQLVAATLVDAPWLRRRQPTGEDASITLRTADGDIHIEGETVLSTYVAAGSHPEFPPLLQQAGARYRWDDEETYGMLERSIPVEQLEE
jgi:hypothetical protein